MSYKRILAGLAVCFQAGACASFAPDQAPPSKPDDPRCAGETYCRKLTDNEIALAKSVFEKSDKFKGPVNYDEVRVIYSPYSIHAMFSDASVPADGNIYIHSMKSWEADYAIKFDGRARPMIMHELTHKAQKQGIVKSRNDNPVQTFVTRLVDRKSSYEPSTITPFEEQGVEQQAQIVQKFIWYADNAREVANDKNEDQKNLWCFSVRKYAQILNISLAGDLAFCTRPEALAPQ